MVVQVERQSKHKGKSKFKSSRGVGDQYGTKSNGIDKLITMGESHAGAGRRKKSTKDCWRSVIIKRQSDQARVEGRMFTKN
jgi:hypothetical protein